MIKIKFGKAEEAVLKALWKIDRPVARVELEKFVVGYTKNATYKAVGRLIDSGVLKYASEDSLMINNRRIIPTQKREDVLVEMILEYEPDIPVLVKKLKEAYHEGNSERH